MKSVPKFYAKGSGSALVFESPRSFSAYIRSLISFHPKRRLEVVVRPVKKPGTNKQRAYYFGGVLTPISELTGYTTEELHEIFKARAGFVVTRRWKGIDYYVAKSLTDMDTVEQTKLIDFAIREAADLGIEIMSPDEWREKMFTDEED